MRECLMRFRLPVFCVLVVALISLAACSNPEKAKAQHLSRGEAYLKEKKYQEASLEFRNAIQIDEKLAPAHWGLAQAYEGLDRLQDAFAELKITIELDPNNLDARVRLGNYYLSPSKDPFVAEAERLAREVLDKDPNHIEGHILMGNVLFLQDRAHPERALAELNRAIELDPKRIESYIALTRFYMNTKDANKTEETFRRALSIDSNSTVAHREYGKFLAQMNRPAEAETEFKRAIETSPSDYESRFVLASFYLVNKQMDKAEQAYKDLAEVDKDRPDGRAVLADFYASIGRYPDAINTYQQLAAQYPDYVRARYRLGEIMLQNGDMGGANAQVAEALKKNEHDMQALLLRSRIRLQSGDPRGAIEDLKEVLKQQPNHQAGLYFMAEANYRAGQIEQARAFAGDLERFYPDYLPAKLMQIQLNLASGDAKSALNLANDLIDKLSKTAPSSELPPQLLAELRLKTLTSRGLAQLKLNNTKAARADLEAARDEAPNTPSVYNNLANVALIEKKTDEAASLYDKALSIDNTNYDALSGLLYNIYAPQKHLDQAHARVDQAIAVAQNSSNKTLQASLHFLKARVFDFERNNEGIESELRQAIALDDKYLAAYSALGAFYANTNQQDRAIAEYRNVIAQNPQNTVSNATAYTLIGMLEDGRGNYDAAAENYRKALEMDENNVLAANNLAWLYAAHGKGNLDEAVRLAQGVVQKNPDEAGFVDTLGWVYYKKGLHAAAVEQLQKVVSKNGNSPVYRYHLGMAFAGQGDKQNARRELEQALKLGQGRNFAEADDARKALQEIQG